MARRSNPVHKLLGITQPAEEKTSASGKRFAYYPNCPGKAYYAQLRKEFNQDAASGTWEQTEFNKLRKKYADQILDVSGFKPMVQIDASPFVSVQIASVDGKLSVFLANFKGLKSKEVAQQIPEQNVKIAFSADGPRPVAVLPFLGAVGKLQGTFSGGALTVEIPAIDKGAVVWVE